MQVAKHEGEVARLQSVLHQSAAEADKRSNVVKTLKDEVYMMLCDVISRPLTM